MQRLGPPHYHQGSSNLCYCVYSGLPQQAPSYNPRPHVVVGDPRDYGPPARRVPKPKSKDKVAKTREMKFDEETQEWFFETPEAPGVKWLESTWHVPDLPQAKDPDFLAMLNEYYLCGHVMDEPDQDRLPVIPGGMRRWVYKRSPPPLPESQRERPLPPPPPQDITYIEPIYRHPSAPPYASGSAHPTSTIHMPPGFPHPDGLRIHSTNPHLPQSMRTLQTHYSHPGPPGVPSRPPPMMLFHSAPEVPTLDDSDVSDSEFSRSGSGRTFIPPPSPKSRRRAEKLKSRGYRVQDPYENAGHESESQSKSDVSSRSRHSRHYSLPQPQQPYTYPTPSTTAFIPPSSYLPKLPDQKIDVHRLLQTRSTLGISKIPELVFDLRYDPKHAFDRTANGGNDNEYWSGGGGGGKGKESSGGTDLATAPAFQPGQDFVRLVIRHPFSGRGGDWVEDIDEARNMTVLNIVNFVSEMMHRHIDQALDWDPLSENDRSFVYEAYLNRPCPDEDAAGKRLHLFCDKYMFGGIEQLPAKAKGASAEGPSFLVKLMRNSKHKQYERLTGFSVPRQRVRRQPSGRSHTTFPTLADSVSGSGR